ncbi:hypothetical protein MMPV_005654 [Pyropia vietnamensis]
MASAELSFDPTLTGSQDVGKSAAGGGAASPVGVRQAVSPTGSLSGGNGGGGSSGSGAGVSGDGGLAVVAKPSGSQSAWVAEVTVQARGAAADLLAAIDKEAAPARGGSGWGVDSGGGSLSGPGTGGGIDGPSSSRASRSIRRLGTFSKSTSFAAGPPRSGSMARLAESGGGSSSKRSLHVSSTVRLTNTLRVFVSTPAVTLDKFRSQGGVKAVLAPLRAHTGSAAVTDAACRVLLGLTIYDASTAEEIVSGDGVATVLAALEALVASAGVASPPMPLTPTATTNVAGCASAIKALRNLTQTADHRGAIIEAGGIEGVVAAMATHHADARLCSHGCLVLSNLAFGVADTKDRVGGSGGLDAIATAMLEHPDCQPVAARGSLALRNLLFKSNANQDRAGASGSRVIEALVSVIFTHGSRDREVAHQSCVALCNLSNVKEANRAPILAAGGVRAVLTLLSTYPESATVADDAVGILRNVAAAGETAPLEVGQCGGVEAVVRAMKAHPCHGAILEKGIAALRYLCFLPENRDRVGTAGGVDLLVGALSAPLSSPKAVESAFLALGNAIFGHTRNQERAGMLRSVSAVLAAANKHGAAPGVQEHACRVLRALCEGNDATTTQAVCGGAVSTALSAIVAFPADASIAEQATALLLCIGLEPSRRQALVDADTAQIVGRAMETHVKHRGVQLQGGQLRGLLAGQSIEPIPGAGAPAAPAAAAPLSPTAAAAVRDAFAAAAREAHDGSGGGVGEDGGSGAGGRARRFFRLGKARSPVAV